MPKRHRPGASASSLVRHVEDLVLATSGEDAFELVFALAAGRVVGAAAPAGSPLDDASSAARRAAEREPSLEIRPPQDAPPELLAKVDALLARALGEGDGRLQALDAVFEALVPRVAKGDKGQFFTPRHVVDFVIRALAPTARDVVVDPACGSGAFLAHACAFGASRTFGCDVDLRAVRVARLVALSQGRDPGSITRGDGLRAPLPTATIVATNPPFAGIAPADGFETARLVRRPERDVLFLERALTLLAPRGRIGIVLPYNKASGVAFGALRAWLARSARILAVVGLPGETFQPYTSQRTFVLFAERRDEPLPVGAPLPDEPIVFAVSERAGKDAGGDPIYRDGDPGALDHDLDETLAVVLPVVSAGGGEA